MSQPEVRANHSKHLIGRVKLLDEPARSRTFGCIGGLRDEIRAAGVFDWLPAEHHVRLTDCVQRVLGSDGARGFFRDLLLDGFSRALLRPLVSGAVGIYGRTPHSLLRLSPHAWTLVTRDCGMLSYSRSGDDAAGMQFRELPELLQHSAGMLAFFQGGLESTFSYFSRGGAIDAVRSAPGELDFDVRWLPAP